MAYMRRQEELVLCLAAMEIFSVGEASVFEARIDEDLVSPVRKLHELSVRKTKAPALLVVGRAIRNQVRLIRQRMYVFLQL